MVVEKANRKPIRVCKIKDQHRTIALNDHRMANVFQASMTNDQDVASFSQQSRQRLTKEAIFNQEEYTNWGLQYRVVHFEPAPVNPTLNKLGRKVRARNPKTE